jgi:hypothetical protein
VHVGEMQKKLSQWATEDADRKITDLYRLLCNAEWLRVAHRHVNANQGRETAGIDGETMQRFNENLEAHLETLRALLKAKAFEPVPVNRVYIPKPDGRKRPLGILMACAYCISSPRSLGMIIVEAGRQSLVNRIQTVAPDHDASHLAERRLTSI